MNKEHLEFVSSRSAVNPDFLPYSTHRTAPYLLWDDAVSHSSSSRTCCSCTCCRAITVALVILLVSCVFAVVGVVIYLGIITNNFEDRALDEEIIEGSMKVIEGDRFSSALQDTTSPEFNIKAQTYETLLSTVYKKSSLSDAFIRTQITAFQNGSLIVYFRLYLDRRKLPTHSVQKAYDVMREEVQQDHPLAFKTVRVDPNTLNISGISFAHKINFVDYFTNDEESFEMVDSIPTTSSTTTSSTTTATTSETIRQTEATEHSSELITPPYMKHHQQGTHKVDYGKWEPFVTERAEVTSTKKTTPQQGLIGSVSEISFDWEPDEGIAAFFPSTPPSRTRVGVGLTLNEEADNSQEFRSRVLPPSKDDVVIRMDSPSLTINRKGIGSISSEWVPLSPLPPTEPTSKELLASRDDPKLGFGLRVTSPTESEMDESSKNVLLKNQSSHAVIVRLPPGSHPRRNNGSRLSSALQRRQEEWQRVRQSRLQNINDELINSTESTEENLSVSTEMVPNARLVPLHKVNVNIVRDPPNQKARHGVRDIRERSDWNNINETKYSLVTSVSMETSVGNASTTSVFELLTVTSVVTSVAEEISSVTESTSVDASVANSSASNTKKQKSLFGQNYFFDFPELSEYSDRELTVDDANSEGDQAREFGAQTQNVTVPSLPVEIRNRSAISNSVLFNEFGYFSEESIDEESNILVSTENEDHTKKLTVPTTHKAISTTFTNRCKNPSMFQCQSGECVPNFSRCNRIKDCLDNSDERDCTCADFIRINTFNSTLCDGIVDCWDYSDENQCEWCTPNMHVCPNSRTCIHKINVCDGIADCPNGEDEKHCVTIAPNISAAGNGIYWPSGLVLVRKEGQWGKLCMQNFNSFVSEAQVAVGDLSRVVCQTMGFNDFEEGKEIQEPIGNIPTEDFYFEPQYNNISSNARSVAIDFFPTRCDSREVISVRCKEFACGRRHQSVKSRARIVGGYNSVPGSWPWQAAVYKEGNFMCGATLISSQYLLSAAHCFYLATDHYWTVRLGVLRRGSFSPYERIRRISHIIIHPNYVANNFINDIVLLRMEKQIQFSDYIRPICLPTVDETQTSISNKQRCTVIGWGQIDEDGDYLPDTLQEVKLPLISAINCRTYTTALTSYARVNHNMFCAGVERGGRDACLGDSGGPLMCQQTDGRWTLTGVTSNGFGCARPSRPGIYTKVVNYRGWINRVIDNSLPRPVITSCNGFRCPLGKCLNRKQVCDGFVDCMDASDERECVWPRKTS